MVQSSPATIIITFCGVLVVILVAPFILVQSPVVVMVREGELLGLLCLAVSLLANTVPWLEGPDHGEVRTDGSHHSIAQM